MHSSDSSLMGFATNFLGRAATRGGSGRPDPGNDGDDVELKGAENVVVGECKTHNDAWIDISSVVKLLATLLPPRDIISEPTTILKKASYLKTAIGCGGVVWSRGLLKKGYSLCHGVSGNAYSLISLYQYTKNPKGLYRACKFANWCMNYEKHCENIPDRPCSLFEGLAGTIYFLVDLCEPKLSKFPAYTYPASPCTSANSISPVTFEPRLFFDGLNLMSKDNMENPRTSIFLSEKCVFDNCVCPAILVTVDGRIETIFRDYGENSKRRIYELYPEAIFQDFGSSVLMAGVVDSHVHVNDPGRAEWEGFWTATRAAAAGGITTIVDMPLNAIPPTTSVKNLEEKVRVAKENAFVDVAFWGGVIPGNKNELKSLVQAGVVGFKCFLLPSGIDEFPHVTFDDVDEALEELKSTNSVLAFHAECELDEDSKPNGSGDAGVYENFLNSRPSSMEVRAIEKVASACKKFSVRCHIVHLSAAEALEVVANAKRNGAPLTAETCHHYLILDAAQVPNGATEYKCCPPIRKLDNQKKLWQALRTGTLDMIISDHSPCTEDIKKRGDFVSAWGGISSLQFGLSLTWTGARERGFSLMDVSRFLSANPAKLCGLDGRKGKIAIGADADFVVWEPNEKFTIHKAEILHKNKLTPYEGRELFGRVRSTYLRGQCIYKNGKVMDELIGKLLLNDL